MWSIGIRLLRTTLLQRADHSGGVIVCRYSPQELYRFCGEYLILLTKVLYLFVKDEIAFCGCRPKGIDWEVRGFGYWPTLDAVYAEVASCHSY